MPDFYGTAAAVITRTGVQPEDLGLADSDALTDFVEDVLAEVTELFDRKMRTSYLEEDTIPAGLSGVANDAASNSVREMVVTRQTPVVRIDDFAVRTIQSRVLTPDVLDRLKLYSAGQGVGTYLVEQDELAPLPDFNSITAADLANIDTDAP
jgi:hypothetical protein